MAEPTGASPAQAAEPAQPQAGAPASQEEPETPTDTTPTPDAAALQRELAEARKEAARYRTEAKRLSDERKAAEEATLSDLEKANRRVAELERENVDLVTRAQEHSMRLATVDAATRLGFRSPEVAYQLMDRSALEFNEDGSPKNVEKLLKALLEREPYLARPNANGDFGGGTRGTSPSNAPDMNALLRAAARGR